MIQVTKAGKVSLPEVKKELTRNKKIRIIHSAIRNGITLPFKSEANLPDDSWNAASAWIDHNSLESDYLVSTLSYYCIILGIHLRKWNWLDNSCLSLKKINGKGNQGKWIHKLWLAILRM